MQLRISLAIAALAFAVFMANGRVYDGATDSVASRTLPFAILGSGSLYLDSVRDVVVDKFHPSPGWWTVQTKTGHIASLFPVVTPVIATPLYLPAAAYLAIAGRSTERLDALSVIMEKVSAAALSAAAVLFLYLALVRYGVTSAGALVLAGTFAFGTGTWSIASQLLWLHAAALLFCSMALWIMSAAKTKGGVVAVGALIALLFCNRPADAGLAVGLGFAALFWSGRLWPLLISLAAPILGAVLFYNLHLFGHWIGGWGVSGHTSIPEWVSAPVGFAGQLVSPTRGLLVFSPFLVLVPLGIWASITQRRNVGITMALAIGVVLHLLIYAFTDWRGGWSYGPRYQLDAVPILIWLLAPALAGLRAQGRVLMGALIMFSVWVQYVGAFHYANRSDHLIFKDDKNWVPAFANAWKLEHTPFIVEFRNERQRGELLKYLARL